MSSFLYQAFYCEENVWHLCGDARIPGDDKHVVFVSNTARRVAMWGQQAARGPGEPVVWDYHVVLLARVRAWCVWDLDSALGVGIELPQWLAGTFDVARTPPALRPMFRCVDAETFRAEFSSDRRHMQLPDGTPSSAPPPWPCIGTGHTLERFIDMRAGQGPGEVLDLARMKRRFVGS